MSPFEHTDPPLNAHAPIPSAPEPVLRFVGHARCGPSAWLGQHDVFDAVLLRILLAGRRVYFPVARKEPGRTPKYLQMMVKTWLELVRIIRISI